MSRRDGKRNRPAPKSEANPPGSQTRTYHSDSTWVAGKDANDAPYSDWLAKQVVIKLSEILRCVDDINAAYVPGALIVTPLGKNGKTGSQQDRSCDCCGTYVPVGQELFTLKVQPTPDILLVGGICRACKDGDPR